VGPSAARLILLPRLVTDYPAPTWPSNEPPSQVHLELLVDDLDQAEAQLVDLGAAVADEQPLRQNGNVVMLDPAGHPFCIGTRAGVVA
jgi:Glyoxalase-like domain